jgi:hypothetical protein
MGIKPYILELEQYTREKHRGVKTSGRDISVNWAIIWISGFVGKFMFQQFTNTLSMFIVFFQ